MSTLAISNEREEDVVAFSNGHLAVDGGTRLRTHAFAAWPHFSDDEISATADVLRSGKINY
jgi:hypothetical protein